MTIIRGAARLALLALPALVANPVSAQNYDRIAPKEPAQSPPLTTLPAPAPQNPPPSAAESARAAKVIVPSLRGLVFVGGRENVHPAGVEQAGIVTDVDLLQGDDFKAGLMPFLGKPLTFEYLDRITRYVVQFCRAMGHPLVDVVVPEQDVQAGTVQIALIEFRVGNVKVEGNNWFTSEQVAAPILLQHGDRIESESLLDQINAANANPFRHVDLIYRPASQPGYTDLVLHTEDQFPFQVNAGYANDGTPSTGRDRWSAGFTWGDALWLDEIFSYEITTSDDFFHHRDVAPGEPNESSYVGQSVNWSSPLPWGDRLTIFGAYERSAPNIPSFGLKGRSGQASIRYDHALPRVYGIASDIQLGYDFKTTNNNLDFGGTAVSASSVEVDQFLAILSGSLADDWGSTRLEGTLVGSPGGLTGANNTAAYQPSGLLNRSGRAGATADYVYGRLDATRLTRLPFDAVWSLRVIGQLSSAPLLQTEQLTLGGPDLLRGYNPNTINGDQGVVVSNEVRSPSWAPVASLPTVKGQVLAFWDYTYLTDRAASEAPVASEHASSVGVGTRIEVATYAAVKLDYGWQLNKLPDQPSRGQFGFVSVTLTY